LPFSWYRKHAAVLQKEINIGAPQNEKNFLTNSTSVSFSKRAKLLGVTILVF
jgi:hypothetical protein